MTHYDYKVFKACNDKYKGIGQAQATIETVDLKNGVCRIAYYGYPSPVTTTESIQNFVERYIKSTMGLPYITNPSKIKTWKGFYSFTLNEETAHDIDYMLLGLREQYADITKGMGAVRNGLTFNLQRCGKEIVFSGMMSSDIPFRTKKFSINGKDIESLKNEIKAWLFDTFDGIVNIC